MDIKEALAALEKAKIQLMLKADSAFFVSLCFSRKHVFNENIPTACTNGLVVEYNPNFFMNLSPEQRITLLLHETLHGAYLHMERMQDDMDHSRANIAMDHVINLQLQERNYTAIDNWHCDKQFTNMAWEDVYPLIPVDESCSMDDVEPVGSEEFRDKLINEVQNQLIAASIASQQAKDKAGSIPGSIQIYIDKLLNPKLPWQTILRRFLQKFDKSNYSFKKPNKKYLPDFYLPTLIGKSLIDITIAVDTSGSVTDAQFKRFITEIASIIKTTKTKNITLLQFDTRIKSIDKIKSLSSLSKVDFVGRGGTDIEPVLEWANINKPKLLIVFTDGDFSQGDTTLVSPVIWLIHNNPNFTYPFGKVIHYIAEEE